MIIDEANWKPLEDAVGMQEADHYMYMGAEEQDNVIIHLYKHIDTRRYINITEGNEFYVYNGESYTKTTKEIATKWVVE